MDYQDSILEMKINIAGYSKPNNIGSNIQISNANGMKRYSMN